MATPITTRKQMSATQYTKLFLFAVMIFAVQTGVWGQTAVSSLPKMTYTNTSGTTTFIVPAGVYTLTLEAWGGGGGGGRSTSNGEAVGGGGGGAYAKSIYSVTPGQELIITVGAGGPGSAGANNGNPSSVSRSGQVLVRAAGGSGVADNASLGGQGGQANASIYNNAFYPGGDGGKGSGNGGGTAAGGGGGGAGSTGPGKPGVDGITVGSSGGGTGGPGGGFTSEYGGSGGKGTDSAGEGGAASTSTGNYGGGGGGAKKADVGGVLAQNRDGGNGAPGLVRISFPSPPVISLVASTVCQGDAALTATTPHPVVRASLPWEWIVNGQSAGDYTNDPVFTTENLASATYIYKVRVHYENVTWNGITYAHLYDDSQNTVQFTVAQKPVISSPKTTTACSGVAFSVTPANNLPDVVPAGTNYSWSIQLPLPTGVTVATNDPTSGYSITGTLTNSTDAPINVRYVVTPTSGNGCPGDDFNVVVTVNPKPVISTQTVTACSGDLFSIAPTNTAPDVVPTGTSYSWVISPSLPAEITADRVSATGESSINGTLTLNNTITTPQTVTYVVTPKTQPSDGGCTGDPFNVIVTVNPKRVISDQTVAVCSGESVDITNPGGITNATYTWELTSISGGTLDNPLMKGSGNSINVGTLTNTSTSDAFVRYKVTPTSTQDCVGTFDLIVTVRHIPQIEAPSTTICSGQKMQLAPIPSGGSSYSSSDNSIAFIDANGMLYTDVDIVDGVPIERPSHSANEGKGGVVTITYTTANGCVATKNITVTPRTKTPHLRRNFDGTCPEANSSSVSWDWLVVNNGREDVALSQIKWYANEACTQYIRSGGEALPTDGSMDNFSPSVPYHSKVYWATITPTDSCESRPVRVEINIRERPEQFQITDLIGYVQPAETPAIDLLDFLDINLDPTQSVEWYATQDDANNPQREIGEPAALNPTQLVDITYWLIKVDNIDPNDPCRSLPTPFHVRLVPMPTITIAPDKPLVCPGEQVTVTVTINNGTAPYHFKVKNMNSGDIIDESQMTAQANGVYTFTANPLSTDTYRVIELSDATTPLVTDPRLALRSTAPNNFAETVLSVIVTEISGISPNAGPTAGGTYTTDPNDPINPAGIVTISGSGFMPHGVSTVLSVTFGGVAATNIKVVNDNTITCTPPAHLSGYVTVSVTTGCTTATMTDGYRYEPINITGIQPNYAPVTGGTTITIRGTGLLASEDNKDLVTITLANVPATIVSVSNTQIVCITGPSNYSVLDKIVINNGSETREFPQSFTYYPVNFIENGNWSEPHRWETQTSDHILPYPGADVQIKANCVQDINVDMDSITVYPSKAYTLNNGIVLKANVFTLKDDASFLDYNNTSSANMQAVQQNVEHTLTKGRNWYVSSPVQSGTIPTISSALGSARVEYYDEVSHTWKAGTNPFVTGLGYTAYSADADISVKFSGTYTNGNQTTSFNLTRQDDGHPKRGFNLVGNPFPSYWNWTSTAAQQANVYSTIWYRTNVGGVYEFWSYNASGNIAVAPSWKDATPTGSYSLAYIPPMQAFWVRRMDGQNGTLTFTNNLRSHADHNSNKLKSTETANTETRPLLRLDVSNGVSTDETVIYADTEAKKDFDTYDSDKWFVNQGVEIFTQPASSTRKLVINGLPEIVAGTEVSLGFQADEGGSFSFHTKEILNLDTLNVFLSDKWLNTEFDLRTGDYNFTSSSVSVTDRFSIVFRRATGVSGLSDTKAGDDNLLVYTNKNGQMIVVLHLRNQQESNANVSIFDITGRKLAEQSVVVDEQTILKNTFPEGVYVLRAGKCTAKVMVKR